jgi:hypothetical protein
MDERRLASRRGTAFSTRQPNTCLMPLIEIAATTVRSLAPPVKTNSTFGAVPKQEITFQQFQFPDTTNPFYRFLLLKICIKTTCRCPYWRHVVVNPNCSIVSFKFFPNIDRIQSLCVSFALTKGL